MRMTRELIPRLLEVVGEGLTSGLGKREPGKFCAEAAVCYVLDLPHGDKPECVHPVIRQSVITLNDSYWSDNATRAEGLRRLLIAQLGSDTIDSAAWFKHAFQGIVRRVLSPALSDLGEALLRMEGCEEAGGKLKAAAARASIVASFEDACAVCDAIALAARDARDARAARDARDALDALDALAARAALDARDALDALDALAARAALDALDARAALDALDALDALATLDARVRERRDALLRELAEVYVDACVEVKTQGSEWLSLVAA